MRAIFTASDFAILLRRTESLPSLIGPFAQWADYDESARRTKRDQTKKEARDEWMRGTGEGSSAESIPTPKNRESICFDFLLRGFVEKESINDK